MKRTLRALRFERISGLYFWALAIVVFSIWLPQTFPTASTVHSIASEQAVSALLALAVLVPLICGAYDLAIGATANMSTIVAVVLLNRGSNLVIAVAAAVAVGIAIGAINGFLVVRLKVNSFIATLGTASIIGAVQIIITNNGLPLPPTSSSWNNLTQTSVGGFQIVVLYLVVVAIVLWWALGYTPAGRYLDAIGSSPDAARLSGVRVDYYTWLSLVASGGIAGLAGVLYGSLSTPSLTYGASLLLPAFAAVFLGSTQVVPGRFNVWGTLLAIFALATGVKGIQLLSSAQWLDPMFFGVALIVAVAIAAGRRRSGAERKRRSLSNRNRRVSDHSAVDLSMPDRADPA